MSTGTFDGDEPLKSSIDYTKLTEGAFDGDEFKGWLNDEFGQTGSAKHHYFANNKIFPMLPLESNPPIEVTLTLRPQPFRSLFFQEGDIVRIKDIGFLRGNPVVKSKFMVAKMRGKKFQPKYKVTSVTGDTMNTNATLTPHNF